MWPFKRRKSFSFNPQIAMLLINIHELEYVMSALTDAVNRNTASVAALTAAVATLPAPPDESAAAATINANSDAVDAAVAALTKGAPAP
jgi:hypothetical protein